MSEYKIIECRQLTPAQREELIAMLEHVCRENGVLEPFPVLHAVRQLVEHVDELEAQLAMVSQAHERYWRTDGTGIERDVYDAIIAAVVMEDP